jgi:hypothetical protein
VSGDQDYPLSFEQESIWVAERFATGASPYVESWAQRLRGHLNADALTWALGQIATRHPALRSRVYLAGERVVQRVSPDAGLVVETADWRGRPLDEALRSVAQRPLDIREGTVRAGIFELATDDHIVLVQCHHIVVDDYSLGLLSAEIKALYTSAVCGGCPELPALEISPGEYAANQRASGIPAQSLDYWTRYLDGARQSRELLPVRQPPGPRRGNRCGRVSATLDSDLAGLIRSRARAMRTTPTVIFLASLAMALAGVSGVTDVVLGQPVSRRGSAKLEGVFGCFTDIMPLRLNVLPGSAFTDLCGSTKRAVISALSHRDVPWAAIVKRLRSPRDALSGSGLIRVALVVEETTRLTLPDLDCERIYVVPAAAKFDWCVFVVAAGGSYGCYIDYASDQLTPDEAALALRQWTRTLAEVARDPDLTVAALSRTLESGA